MLELTLIDRLLNEQQTLSAVDLFARRHASGTLPAQARYYKDLIPASKPGVGQQYAFAVNLDACTGCKACVSACHSLNGLETDETWRDVGLLVGETAESPYLQTVTTACHHCIEPACLEGCPVMAYDKDAETGIVRHLDDQCIGCQYCTLKCPYDVPKYSKRLGIVRKCDMCHDRLTAGEAPACVQACPHEAITIRLVDVEEISNAAKDGAQMIPGAFASEYTRPTTTYHSRKGPPSGAQPADAHKLHLEHAHWPLLLMLVLTQGAAGLFLAAALARTSEFFLTAGGFALLNSGLFAAIFHLGRPLGAWRFFLGLRTSWMSREILAFSLLAAAATPAMGAAFFLPGTTITFAFSTVTALLAVISVFTSAMIYVDTRRALWAPGQTFARFFGTVVLLGASAAATVFAALGESGAMQAGLVIAMVARTATFGASLLGYHFARRDASAPTHLSALTIQRLLPWLMPARAALFAIATAASLDAMMRHGTFAAAFALVATLLSQVVERYEFFTTVRAPHMPRGI